MHIVCCLPVFVIDSFLPWQSGNTQQFISLQSVFLRFFQQGLTPEVAAPKAAAAADKKHSSVPHCNGECLFIFLNRFYMIMFQHYYRNRICSPQIPDVLCVFSVSGDSSEQTKAPRVSRRRHLLSLRTLSNENGGWCDSQYNRLSTARLRQYLIIS